MVSSSFENYTKETAILCSFLTSLANTQTKDGIVKCAKVQICILNFIQLKPKLIPRFIPRFAGFKTKFLVQIFICQTNGVQIDVLDVKY